MDLSNTDILELVAWRHALHRQPEVSGEEEQTAARVVEMLQPLGTSQIVTGLGGHGVLAVFDSGVPGPSVMIRAELDGLPIQELGTSDYQSDIPGKGHLCGHDGHMAILGAVARVLSRQGPLRGRVQLLFQPAEENGQGAKAVISDPMFRDWHPDWSFALHNMPGLPLGHVALKAGPVNCASRGMCIRLTGRTAHASTPDTGISPAPAIARLMSDLPKLGMGGELTDDFRLVTLTHTRMGEPAFGIAPGEAELWATLRTMTDDHMSDLVAEAEACVRNAAAAAGLQVDWDYADDFRHCENDPDAVAQLEKALQDEGIGWDAQGLPMRASEDFGRFRDLSKSAMFLLGSGMDRAHLHNPDYDFPDDLIPIGARVFLRTVRNLTGMKNA